MNYRRVKDSILKLVTVMALTVYGLSAYYFIFVGDPIRPRLYYPVFFLATIWLMLFFYVNDWTDEDE